MPKTSKKLALISINFILITNVAKKALEHIAKKALKQVLCIYYSIWFYIIKIKSLFDNDSKINAMSPGYTKKLGFKIWKINVKV